YAQPMMPLEPTRYPWQQARSIFHRLGPHRRAVGTADVAPVATQRPGDDAGMHVRERLEPALESAGASVAWPGDERPLRGLGERHTNRVDQALDQGRYPGLKQG